MKKYDTYKDSGIEWIGEIPEHWKVSKVKYNFSFNTGFTPPSGKAEYYDNGSHVWINISDLQKKHINDSVNKITDKAIEDYKPEIIPKNSLLYSFKLSIGRVGFNTIDCYTNEAIFSIHPDDNTNLGFFYYSLPKQIIHNANENIYGAKILNQELIKNAFLIIPPPKEQTAIASYLDQKTSEIDELIADKEELLKLYEEEKTALINQAVTKGIDPNVKMKDSGIDWLGEIPEHWEVKRFKYFFNLINIKTDEKLKKIGLENIESKSGNYIETDSDFAGQGIRFYPNDILFGKLRPYLAKVWLAEFEGHAVGDFYVFRPKNTIFPDFGKYRMLDFSFIEVTNSSTYGSKMPRVSWEFIADLEIAFPSFEEQQSIVNYIESETTRLDDKINNTEKLIELLKEYREALISEVVMGKVKVI